LSAADKNVSFEKSADHFSPLQAQLDRNKNNLRFSSPAHCGMRLLTQKQIQGLKIQKLKKPVEK